MPDSSMNITPMAVAPIPRITLRPVEAARALGVSESTLKTWTREGFVPSKLIGGSRLYSVAELETWARDRDGGAR